MAADHQPNIICDKCGSYGFSGIRYKCFICPNYDLCGTCYEKKEHDAKHPFVHILPGQTLPSEGPPRKVARTDDEDCPRRREGVSFK